jgi:stage IV sporulation protein B
MLPLRDGNVTDVQLTEVMIGKQGTPGQLQGMPIFDTVYGEVSENTKNGIFGTMTTDAITAGRESYPVATESEIKTGDAVILSDAIDGEMREYTIEISRMFPGFVTDGKDMLVTITDERLLDATGGIVQGMSGSPIIQGGKLVGAVTHVLINDPAKGYGIFIENMLDAA